MGWAMSEHLSEGVSVVISHNALGGAGIAGHFLKALVSGTRCLPTATCTTSLSLKTAKAMPSSSHGVFQQMKRHLC